MKKLLFVFICLSIVQFGFGQKLKKSFQNAHKGDILSVAIDNDGSTVISSGTMNRANIWDLKKGEKTKFQADQGNRALSISTERTLFCSDRTGARTIGKRGIDPAGRQGY